MGAKTAVSERITYLRTIEDGWYNGHGEKLSTSGLDYVEQKLNSDQFADLPIPYIFPIFDYNGVQLSWDVGVKSCELNIDMITWETNYLDFSDIEENDVTFDFKNDDELAKIIERIKQFAT